MLCFEPGIETSPLTKLDEHWHTEPPWMKVDTIGDVRSLPEGHEITRAFSINNDF